jgi:xylulose-5-phosphate/fructose-6-phosphate phosphoketolase
MRHLKQVLWNKLIDHKIYISQYGDEMPEIKNWKPDRSRWSRLY